MNDQETIRQDADHQRAVSKEIEQREDRDNGNTAVGFGLMIGFVGGILWLAGVDVPNAIFGIAILFFVGGLIHVAASREPHT